MNPGAVPHPEMLVRRFNPTSESHCTHDDAGLPAKLRSGAFRFDPEPEEIPVAKNLSVYREQLLEQSGMTRFDALEPINPEWAVATISVSEVLAVKRETVPAEDNPFSVLEDSYPEGQPAAHPRDGAHAVIQHALPLRGSDKWYRELASKFVLH